MKISKIKKSFTLIELLLVIAILGILAVVVFVSLSNARARARDAVRLSDLDQVKKALELYKDKNGRYPCQGTIYEDEGDGLKRHIKWSTSAYMVDHDNNPATPEVNRVRTRWIGAKTTERDDFYNNFLTSVPLDPTNDASLDDSLRYAYASIDGENYKIIAYHMESQTGQEKAANDGGITGGWEGDLKYELFSSNGQWYAGGSLNYGGDHIIIDPDGNRLTECLCTTPSGGSCPL